MLLAEVEVPGVLLTGDLPSRGPGRGKIGLSLVVAVLADDADVDAGDDFDEVADRGEGPPTSGEGVSVGMLGGVLRWVRTLRSVGQQQAIGNAQST